MSPSATQERFSPESPFRYVGGAASLDFVNTVDWTPRGLERDRLTDYARVLEWARGAAVVDVASARRLAAAAVRRPRQAEAAVAASREARKVMQEVFSSRITTRQRSAALERFNALLARVVGRLRVEATVDRRLAHGWREFGDAPESVLWPIVWDAANLLWSPDVEKLRMCAGLDCGWLYVDRSRNGLRRWCEMSVCGTAEKNRRRARLTT